MYLYTNAIKCMEQLSVTDCPLLTGKKPIYSTTTTGGLRQTQEDRHDIQTIMSSQGELLVCSVFDGHGGSEIAELCQKHLVPLLKEHLSVYPDIGFCLRKTYTTLDDMSATPVGFMCGSTATTIVIGDKTIWCANCGDTEAMVGMGGTFQVLTQCHKVENEKNRLEKLGANITYNGGCARISWQLNLSRSIGDYNLKEFVISTPYVSSFPMSSSIEYIVLASDGLWDVYKPKEIHNEIMSMRTTLIIQGLDIKQMTDKINMHLVRNALLRGSSDNITVILIMF